MRERTPEETAALAAIQRLQAAYGDAVTRRAWADVRGLFTPDATVEIDTRTRDVIRLEGAAAVTDFVAGALDHFAFFAFTILNAVAEVEGDEGRGRVYIREARHGHDGRWTEAYGLYQDRYRRRDGRWSIVARRYTSLARRGEVTESFPLPAFDEWPGWPA